MIHQFTGIPVFNPFAGQWAGVLRVKRYEPFWIDPDEDRTVVVHAPDKWGAIQEMEQEIQRRIPQRCRECELNCSGWTQIPPFGFVLNDEKCLQEKVFARKQ